MSCRDRTWLLLLVVGMAGCASGPGMPRWDVGGAGWTVVEVPAVWTPAGRREEWTGELLVARGPEGERLVQFSKQGVPVVTARKTSMAWEVGSALGGRGRSGRGEPPSQVVWFHVTELPPEDPRMKGWLRTFEGDGVWVLTSQRGERLEGAVP